jgi:IclR family acetate operon transcriptional repressor
VVSIIQSVDRAISLLEAILASQEEGIPLSTLARRVGLIPSTAYRILATLVQRGYAARDETTRRYVPGPALRTSWGNSRLSLVRQKARAYLNDLAHASGETANLAVAGRHGVIFIDQVASDELVRVVPQSGVPLPMHATAAGKALLAAMPQPLRARYLRPGLPGPRTRRTVRSRKTLEANLKRIQHAGYAIDDEELAVGGRCVAAVVRDAEGHPIAAISLSGPTIRMTPKRLRALGRSVHEAALSLSRSLGTPGHTAGTPARP